MKRFCIFLCFCAMMLAMPATHAFAAGRQNDYPIVFVHGFMGWGRGEFLGYNYWGGMYDIQEDLNKQGYKAYTAAVGPLSSNWDRVCELYAYIKGGTVDYGKVHSEKYGHSRYGRTYPGVYKDWGTLEGDANNNESGEIRKIHLVGHSMGGVDIRLLTQLLAHGSVEEINGTDPEELSPLFKGGKNWVSSVTTIASPHNVSDISNWMNEPTGKQMLWAVAALSGAALKNMVYDFKLDQWGIKRQPGESFNEYYDRVAKSNIWKDKDTIVSDFTPEYVRKFNSWVKAQPDVYYFSWSTEATYTDRSTGHELPEITMCPIWMPSSVNIGSYTSDEADKTWWQNDGMCSTVSESGPKMGSSDVIVEFDGTPRIGVWNHMGILEHFDHTDIVGLFTTWNPTQWYRSLASRLASLPETN
ncbi:MAG: esterase/lipase family protein [Bacillota bacterium]